MGTLYYGDNLDILRLWKTPGDETGLKPTPGMT